MNYADKFCDWLRDYGFTQCFYVAGGNNMFLLKSASTRFKCVPTVHEVAAGIAADYATDSGELLPRVATTPDFFECRFSPWAERCWRLER